MSARYCSRPRPHWKLDVAAGLRRRRRAAAPAGGSAIAVARRAPRPRRASSSASGSSLAAERDQSGCGGSTWSTATTRLASIIAASGMSELCTLVEPQSALQLVAEVADVAAEQPARRRPAAARSRARPSRGRAGRRSTCARRVVGAAAADRDLAGVDVVLEHAAVGAGAGAEVGALREPGRRVGAVEPEGVLGLGEEPFVRRARSAPRPRACASRSSARPPPPRRGGPTACGCAVRPSAAMPPGRSRAAGARRASA